MRHSKSCSNHVRSRGETSYNTEVSQSILDPGLSMTGIEMAKSYTSQLHTNLAGLGIKVDTAVIGSSSLRRAKDTARILFGREPVTFSHFKELGNIPENTPAKEKYTIPHFPTVLRDVYAILKQSHTSEIIIVGHGSFIAKNVWSQNLRRPYPRSDGRLRNLDGIYISGTLSFSGDLVIHTIRAVKQNIIINVTTSKDKCSVPEQEVYIQTKTDVLRRDDREMRSRRRSHHRRSQRKEQRQRGGMPLGYFNDGAQMRETSSFPSGHPPVSSGNWIQPPTTQTHFGGFSPSIMSGFVSAGSRIAPLAMYLGYKSRSSYKTRKSGRK